MHKILLDRIAYLAGENLETNLLKHVTESYRQDDVLSFYQKYISKSGWVFAIFCMCLVFWVLQSFQIGSQHIFSLIVVILFFYLYARTEIKSFTSIFEQQDTELRFLNAILFTYHTYDWKSQSAGLPSEDKSMSSPIFGNKSYLYLYPLAVRFFYEQRYLVYLHFGGYRDSLTSMNSLIEHWWALKHTTQKNTLQALYSWFLMDCTNCYNHFAETYHGLILTPDFQDNYRTGLKQLQEIIQGLREDARDYLSELFLKSEIDHEWFLITSNEFPVAYSSPEQTFIPSQ